MSLNSGTNSTSPDNRFSPITDNDKSGILWITCLLSSIYAALSILIRWYQKRKCFGIDDWVCVAATIVGGGFFTAIFVSLTQGLGKSSSLRDASRLQNIGQFALGANALWGFASMIGVSIFCQPSGLLETNSAHYNGQALRWKIIGAFDGLTEILVRILTLGLIWRLQMGMELKIRVIVAFVFRLPVVAIAVIHSYYIASLPPTDLSLAIIPAVTIE